MATTANDTLMTIGELAQRAGVGVETIRYYQRCGLLAAPPRPAGGFRRYGDSALGRLGFIRAAKRLGFSLDEVSELLALDDVRQCGVARAQAERKLAVVRQRVVDLQRIESVLDALVRRCQGAPGRVSCPLIAALHGG